MNAVPEENETTLPQITDGEIKRPDFRWVSIDQLTPYDKNPRQHSDDDVRIIMHSLVYYGWTNPVQVQKGTNLVISGHGRLEAAKRLGLKQVPVVELNHDEHDARGYRVMDNKSAELSYWNDKLLKVELVELDAEGFNLGLTGFSDIELKERMEGPNFSPVSQDEQARLDQKKQVTCPSCGNEFTP